MGQPNRARIPQDWEEFWRSMIKRTVLEVRPVLGCGKVHLDVVEGLALAQIVVIGDCKQPSPVPPDDRLQVSSMNVEGKGFESVHFPPEISAARKLRKSATKGCLGDFRRKSQRPARCTATNLRYNSEWSEAKRSPVLIRPGLKYRNHPHGFRTCLGSSYPIQKQKVLDLMGPSR